MRVDPRMPSSRQIVISTSTFPFLSSAWTNVKEPATCLSFSNSASATEPNTLSGSARCLKQRSSRLDPVRPLEIPLHSFYPVMKRNVAAGEESLEIQLWQPCELRRQTQSQSLNPKQRQRKFSLQLCF